MIFRHLDINYQVTNEIKIKLDSDFLTLNTKGDTIEFQEFHRCPMSYFCVKVMGIHLQIYMIENIPTWSVHKHYKIFSSINQQ